MLFSKKLTLIRNFRNYSQKQLAAKLGIDQSEVCRYESKNCPDIKYSRIMAISVALDISPEYFFLENSIQYYLDKAPYDKHLRIKKAIPELHYEILYLAIEAYSDKCKSMEWANEKNGNTGIHKT